MNVDMYLRRSVLFLCAMGVSLAAGCAEDKTDTALPDPVAQCAITIDRFKELVVVDGPTLAGGRAKNSTDGPWSFRHAITAAMAPTQDPSEFVLSWLNNWATTTTINGFPTDLESRAEAMGDFLVCPWLRETPTNQCDAKCGTCLERKLDLAKAPFRLIAIVNRIDLKDRPDPDVQAPSGEARLVFALTSGPADDPASPTRAMTLILEYRLPESLSAEQWADAWHHLGTHPSHDEAFQADLETLTKRFVDRGSSPSNPNGSGSALARVRTNESAFNWIWQLRQFTIDSAGQLRLVPVTNTPGESLNGSNTLRDYILANKELIAEDKHILPKSMLGGSADQLRFRWQVSGVDEPTRLAFARGTCNGCHSGENQPVDTAFHISPFASGEAKLSPFVNNPKNPAADELGKREVFMKRVLCTKK